MLSKPCGWSRCPELVTADKPYLLARKKYHAIACQVAAKKAAGWQPHRHLNAENRRRGGRASAKRTHALWHRRNLETAVHDCLDLVPRQLTESLSARDLALLKVLLGRAFERGRRREHRILAQRERRRLTEEKGAAA